MQQLELPLIDPNPRSLDPNSSMTSSSSPRSPIDRRKGPTKFTVNIPESYTSSKSAAQSSSTKQASSRWSTLEFKIYGLMFAIVVPLMIWVPVRLSLSSHANYTSYAHRLSPGWIFGRQIDNSDAQYRSFRGNIPSLLLLGTAHLLSSALFTYILSPRLPSLSRTTFLCYFNIALIFVLHGSSALKVLAIVIGNHFIVNWAITNREKGKWGVGAIWAYNILILFSNDYFGGYRFSHLHTSLTGLDSYSGLLPRWHIHFNMTMLRLISYGMDKYWAVQSLDNDQVSKVTLNPNSNRERVRASHSLEEYSLTQLIAYSLYPPLYIAGPIMTFNDFVWQIKNPIPPNRRTLISYALRFLSCLLTMEVVLHFMYLVAIKDTGAWQGDTPAELSMVGFWNLIIVWLKLLIPWRFFRLWALADGMDPPENMVRCMANNYSTLGFWRSWHRSYNLWIVRYIYVPLGGASNVILATLLVFTFVALWHDLSFKLLAWGWLVSLFILPELLARKAVPASKFGETWWYRHLAAAGAVMNVNMMMVANLVGFAIGLDGVKFLLSEIIATWHGLAFLGFSCVCLFIAVQVMFEYRETEARQGIQRRC